LKHYPLLIVSSAYYNVTMKYRAILFFTLFYWGSMVDLEGQVTFRDPIAGVSMISPDSLKCAEKYVQTPTGEVFYKSCTLEIKHKSHTVKFGYYLTSYPFELIDGEDKDWRNEFFEETRQASAKAVLGEIVYYSNEDFKEYPGTVWRVAYDKGKGVIKSKAYVKGVHFINVKVDYPILVNLPEIDRYIQSLYLE
jgi:hypothetical protein